MCYKTEVQKKNGEILKRKLDGLNMPLYMRKYFTVKIESKAGAIKNKRAGGDSSYNIGNKKKCYS